MSNSNTELSAGPCCGTQEDADVAGACCAPAAKADAIASGAASCGSTSDDLTLTAKEPTMSAIANQQLPVVVIGAGPIGLAAAAHLVEHGIAFQVLEAGDQIAASVAAWGHVRLFSPWRFNIDSAARRLLEVTEWEAPPSDNLPTGAQLISDYLAPLAASPQVAPHVRLNATVQAISRTGYDRLRTAGRENAPFLIRLSTGEEISARAIIEASGTWTHPNVAGANGLPARGENDAAAHIDHALPDVLGADSDRFARRHTLVIGSGHSAANTLLALVRLAEQAPSTTVSWAIRGRHATRTYGGGAADALPARGRLGTKLHEAVNAGAIKLLTGFYTTEFLSDGDSITVISRDPVGEEQKVTVDQVVSATGFRPDHGIAAELRLDLDPLLGSPRELAPLIDPNQHSCGTVPPHGVDELSHPEPGYYAIGVKSYGRAPTFLLATGHEQARSVTAALAGDWDAARNVELELPETGVCSTNLIDEPAGVGAGVKQGLATGISGGLIA